MERNNKTAKMKRNKDYPYRKGGKKRNNRLKEQKEVSEK